MGECAVRQAPHHVNGEVLCDRALNVYDNSNSQSCYSRGRSGDTDAADHQGNAQGVTADR